MRPDNFLLLLTLSSLLLSGPAAVKCVVPSPAVTEHVATQENEGDLFSSQLSVASPGGKQSAGELFGGAIGGALKVICGKTRDPAFCAKAAKGRLSSSVRNVEPKAVLFAGMEVAAQAATVARDAATKFLKQAHLTKIQTSTYETCQENYQAAIDDIEEIKNALAAKDFAAAKSHVDSFGANFGTCADNFADEPGPSPFAKFDDKLTKVWENMLDIYELIDPNPSNI